MDAKNLWQTILAELEITLSKGSFKTFFSNSRAQSFDNNLLTIALANAQIKNFVEERFGQVVLEICQRITKKNVRLAFVINKTNTPMEKISGPLFDQEQNSKTQVAAKFHLRPDFTFDNFAVSSSNQLAHAAAQAVVKSVGTAYNPLYLWGGVGVGKTHLMHAIGHALLAKNPNIKIVYCMSEEFTNEITVAIRNRTTDRFREKYRGADVLLIDDIQFIAGKNTTQEEFFHTFNVVQREGGQVILTSDKPPHEITGLEDRIRSRFEGGLIADIQPPDFELRTAILLIKAKQKDINLPMDVAQLIAERVDGARKLEGVLARLVTESQTKHITLDISFAQEIMGQPTPAVKKAPVKDVYQLISSFYGVKMSDLKGQSRKKEMVFPRQVLMWLLHQELGLTLEEVGGQLGNRDHTTILHGCEKIKALFNTSEKIKTELLGIKQRLYGQIQ